MCQRQRSGCEERPAVQEGLKKQAASLSLALMPFQTLPTKHKFEDKITKVENTMITVLRPESLIKLSTWMPCLHGVSDFPPPLPLAQTHPGFPRTVPQHTHS